MYGQKPSLEMRNQAMQLLPEVVCELGNEKLECEYMNLLKHCYPTLNFRLDFLSFLIKLAHGQLAGNFVAENYK